MDAATSTPAGQGAAQAAGSARKARLYIGLLLLALAAAFAAKLRIQGVFACPAGADDGKYVAYCQATGYGDYDHGAFWFGLERDAIARAAAADVLFLGSSRLQFAFSTSALRGWMAEQRASHYLLGFSHTENVLFTGPLLQRLQPNARAYVINVDRFFDDRATPPTRDILHADDTDQRYRNKQLWQRIQRPLCTALPLVCGSELTFTRERSDGHWILQGRAPFTPSGVSDGPPEDRARWDHFASIAASFVGALPVDRNCVFLTIAPYPQTRIDEARFIAQSLGRPLIVPPVADLKTFDSSHLDPPSSERWTAAFLALASDDLRRCLRDGGTRP